MGSDRLHAFGKTSEELARHAGDGTGDHQAEPIRWRDEPEGQRHDRHDREVNGVHVDRLGEWLQHRADDDDGRNGVEEAADDQEHEGNEEADADRATLRHGSQ